MRIPSILFRLTRKKKTPGVSIEPSSLATVDAIFHYTLTLLTNPESVKEIFQKYDEVRRLPIKNREQAIIQVYFILESFITQTKPVITKVSYTIESLRRQIREHISLEGLSSYFRLVFLPENDQAVVLFTAGIREILSFIESKLAQKHIEESLAAATKGTLLSGITFTLSQVTEEAMRTKLTGATHPQIVSAFRALYDGASAGITQAVGDKKANEVFRGVYDFVKTTYSFDIVGLFMDVLPKQLFESERLGMLSREELERNVIVRTNELSAAKALVEEKFSEIEKKNRELEETKRAVLNILDDEKRLRTQLQFERDQAQTILTSMGEGLYVISRLHKIIAINEAAQNMLGVDSGDVVGKDWTHFVDFEKGGSLMLENLWPESITLKEGKPMTVGIDDNISLRKSNGDAFPVSLKATPLTSDGEIIGAVVVFENITPQKKEKDIIEATVLQRTRQLSEKTAALTVANDQIKAGLDALAKEEAKLSSSIDSLTLGFIMTDTQGQILILNPAATKVLGVGKEIKNLSQIDDKLGETCDLQGLSERCHRERAPVHIPDLAYGQKFLSFFIAPILTKEHYEDIGTVILVEDISERKVMERSRDEFFSIASHELRTPLTTIRGNASLIKQYYADKITDTQVIDMIVDIHESAVRLIGIVNDFLNMSRLELGKIVFAKEKFDITALVGEVVKELTTPLKEKNLSIASKRPTFPLPHVVADRNRVKEVLINLIGNSVKFTTVGGITITAHVQEPMVKIEVTDTGRGIPLANQNLLFRKFQQAGTSLMTRDTMKGTGLGLYISKLMIEGMGGTIQLEKSEEGKGTTFSLTLPIASTLDLTKHTTLTDSPTDQKMSAAVVAF